MIYSMQSQASQVESSLSWSNHKKVHCMHFGQLDKPRADVMIHDMIDESAKSYQA